MWSLSCEIQTISKKQCFSFWCFFITFSEIKTKKEAHTKSSHMSTQSVSEKKVQTWISVPNVWLWSALFDVQHWKMSSTSSFSLWPVSCFGIKWALSSCSEDWNVAKEHCGLNRRKCSANWLQEVRSLIALFFDSESLKQTRQSKAIVFNLNDWFFLTCIFYTLHRIQKTC